MKGMQVKSKSPKTLVDSRHMKILAVKKEELKDALMVVLIGEEKVGLYDISVFRESLKDLQRLESSSDWLLSTKKFDIRIYDKKDLKNRDLIVTVDHKNEKMEQVLSDALSGAKSIRYVYGATLQIEKE